MVYQTPGLLLRQEYSNDPPFFTPNYVRPSINLYSVVKAVKAAITLTLYDAVANTQITKMISSMKGIGSGTHPSIKNMVIRIFPNTPVSSSPQNNISAIKSITATKTKPMVLGLLFFGLSFRNTSPLSFVNPFFSLRWTQSASSSATPGT